MHWKPVASYHTDTNMEFIRWSRVRDLYKFIFNCLLTMASIKSSVFVWISGFQNFSNRKSVSDFKRKNTTLDEYFDKQKRAWNIQYWVSNIESSFDYLHSSTTTTTKIDSSTNQRLVPRPFMIAAIQLKPFHRWWVFLKESIRNDIKINEFIDAFIT